MARKVKLNLFRPEGKTSNRHHVWWNESGGILSHNGINREGKWLEPLATTVSGLYLLSEYKPARQDEARLCLGLATQSGIRVLKTDLSWGDRDYVKVGVVSATLTVHCQNWGAFSSAIPVDPTEYTKLWPMNSLDVNQIGEWKPKPSEILGLMGQVATMEGFYDIQRISDDLTILWENKGSVAEYVIGFWIGGGVGFQMGHLQRIGETGFYVWEQSSGGISLVFSETGYFYLLDLSPEQALRVGELVPLGDAGYIGLEDPGSGCPLVIGIGNSGTEVRDFCFYFYENEIHVGGNWWVDGTHGPRIASMAACRVLMNELDRLPDPPAVIHVTV